MAETQGKMMVKKTVVLHPIMDEYVRKTWAVLIDEGHDANYSTALNFMLLAAVMEAARQQGFAGQTVETLESFLNDQGVLQRLNLHDHLANLRDFWGMNT